MKKWIISLAVASMALLSAPTFASIDRCDDEAGFCACFIKQAVKACNNGCAPIPIPCFEAFIVAGLNGQSEGFLKSQCPSQVANGSRCVSSGTDIAFCSRNIEKYKRQCH